MITEDTKITCGWCNEVFTAEQWNDNSKKECYTREMRRAYKDIYNPKVFKQNTKPAWYKCPKCELWSKGSQLQIVDTKDEELLKLGGEPIIKSVDKD